MARDVALRELDQAGFRISNLGDPTAASDATRTDNTTVPKANAGTGSAGTSLLAAAADHVHPATLGQGAVSITIDDPTQQACSGTDVIWESTVSFGDLTGDLASCFFSAITKATGGQGSVALYLGGTPGKPDGTKLVELQTASETETFGGARGEAPKPVGVALLKVVASTAAPAGVVFARAKSITIRGR